IQYDITLAAHDSHFDWIGGLKVEQWRRSSALGSTSSNCTISIAVPDRCARWNGDQMWPSRWHLSTGDRRAHRQGRVGRQRGPATAVVTCPPPRGISSLLRMTA